MSRADGTRIRGIILQVIDKAQGKFHESARTNPELKYSLTLSDIQTQLSEETSCATIPGVKFHLDTLSAEGLISRKFKEITLTPCGQLVVEYMSVDLAPSVFERRVREVFGSYSQQFAKLTCDFADLQDRKYTEKPTSQLLRKIQNQPDPKKKEIDRKATSAEVIRVAKKSRSNTHAAKELNLSESAFRDRLRSIITGAKHFGEKGIKELAV